MIDIVRPLMVIDTRSQAFNIREIDNRRFMYQPQTGTLILGSQYASKNFTTKSHAVEHFDSGVSEPYDSFVRGWVGNSKKYRDSIIHFAPHIDTGDIELLDRAFYVLEMFRGNGANGKTVIRGFGLPWEQPLSNLLPEKEKSILVQLQDNVKTVSQERAGRTKAPSHKEGNAHER